MFRLKESKLRPVDKSMRKLHERKKYIFPAQFFLQCFQSGPPAYIPTTGIITTVYSKTAP